MKTKCTTLPRPVITRAMHRIHSQRYRFCYDAYFYCERRPAMRDILLTLQELEHETVISNECLIEYSIDILAGRCEPMTQDFIKTLSGKDII